MTATKGARSLTSELRLKDGKPPVSCDRESCARVCIGSHDHERRYGTGVFGGCKCAVHAMELN